MPITPEISQKLLELKEESGLTFKQIAEIVNSSEPNVRRYISGITKVPDKQLLHAIIRAMDGDPEEVFGKRKLEQLPAASQKLPETALYDRLLDSIKAAYEKTIESKDNWIERLKRERDEAEEKIEKLEDALLEAKKTMKHLRAAIVILAALVLLFILINLCLMP